MRINGALTRRQLAFDHDGGHHMQGWINEWIKLLGFASDGKCSWTFGL
jgi:hypothetical protein